MNMKVSVYCCRWFKQHFDTLLAVSQSTCKLLAALWEMVVREDAQVGMCETRSRRTASVACSRLVLVGKMIELRFSLRPAYDNLITAENIAPETEC